LQQNFHSQAFVFFGQKSVVFKSEERWALGLGVEGGGGSRLGYYLLLPLQLWKTFGGQFDLSSNQVGFMTNMIVILN
jgi:hypothetical protein